MLFNSFSLPHEHWHNTSQHLANSTNQLDIGRFRKQLIILFNRGCAENYAGYFFIAPRATRQLPCQSPRRSAVVWTSPAGCADSEISPGATVPGLPAP